MPMVDDSFVWPQKDGYPLNFVGQVQCCRFESLPMQEGNLLFFYDNRHWGYSPKDTGHAVVLHQHGSRVLNRPDLPKREVRFLFGLLKKMVTPRIFQQVHVSFDRGLSYPSLDRELVYFGDEVAEECYIEFCESILAPAQIGGFPRPVQSDDMEQTCVNAINLGEQDDWVLLLQLSEIGDF
jgi:uncharacterized protein YwqG